MILDKQHNKVYTLGMKTDDKHRLTIFIDPSIAKHAKAEAIVEDITLTEYVEKALLAYLPKETIIKKKA